MSASNNASEKRGRPNGHGDRLMKPSACTKNLPDHPVRGAINLRVCGRLRPAGHGTGQTSFGELTGESSARCAEMQAALAAGGVASTVSENIMTEMRGKFCGMAALSLPKSSPQPRNRKALACYQAAMAGAPPARLASKDEALVPSPMINGRI